MRHDDRREIFERLAALERLVRSQHGDRGGVEEHRRGEHDRERWDTRRRDRDRDDHDDDFQEKRIIDTIVRLVSEQIGRLVEEQQARSQHHDDGGGEKRIVDLIVGLVSEHVQEIVSTELDRRLGRADAPRGGEDRSACAPSAPPPPAEPEQP